MLKYVVGGALTIVMFTGCPRTGIDPIDDATQSKKTCERSFVVNNASSSAINIHMNLFEATMDARCGGNGTDQQTLTVPAGQSATVKANLSCETCMVNEVYSVDSSSPAVNYQNSKMDDSLSGNSGTESAVCTDTGCTGS